MEKTLKDHLRDYGLRPKKSLGQVFLIERSVQKKILEMAELGPDDTVVEIGPGTGALTREILPVIKRLIALEIDHNLVSFLQGSLRQDRNLHLLCINALHFDYMRASDRLGVLLKVVGNLPYVISSPLLFNFFEQRKAFSLLILMLQKEVAERLTALPGTKEYGALTVLSGFYFHIEKKRKVSRHCFSPVPKVDSMVIRCTPRAEEISDSEFEKEFRKVVKAAFSKRRKTLFNALRLSSLLDVEEDRLREVLSSCSIDAQRRPETLVLEEFLQLARCFKEISEAGRQGP